LYVGGNNGITGMYDMHGRTVNASRKSDVNGLSAGMYHVVNGRGSGRTVEQRRTLSGK